MHITQPERTFSMGFRSVIALCFGLIGWIWLPSSLFTTIFVASCLGLSAIFGWMAMSNARKTRHHRPYLQLREQLLGLIESRLDSPVESADGEFVFYCNKLDYPLCWGVSRYFISDINSLSAYDDESQEITCANWTLLPTCGNVFYNTKVMLAARGRNNQFIRKPASADSGIAASYDEFTKLAADGLMHVGQDELQSLVDELLQSEATQIEEYYT